MVRRSTTTCRWVKPRARRSSSPSTSIPACRSPEVPYETLKEEVERLARTWDDDLHDALVDRVGAQRGAALAEAYAPRFPDYFKSNRDWTLIVDDVLCLDELERGTEGFLVGLGNESAGERLTRVKLYKTGGKVDLSAFMPILEALGLRVVEEVPTGLLGRRQGLHPRLRRVGLPWRRARPGAQLGIGCEEPSPRVKIPEHAHNPDVD